MLIVHVTCKSPITLQVLLFIDKWSKEYKNNIILSLGFSPHCSGALKCAAHLNAPFSIQMPQLSQKIKFPSSIIANFQVFSVLNNVTQSCSTKYFLGNE